MLPNYVILRINMIDQMDTNVLMTKKTQFPPYQTPSKMHIHKECVWFTNKTTIRIKENKNKWPFYWMPCSYHGRSRSSSVDWITEKKIDAAAYEKIKTKMERYHQLREKMIVMIKLKTG